MSQAILDAQILSNRRLLERLTALSRAAGWTLGASPAVLKELRRGRIPAPAGIGTHRLSEEDAVEVARLLRRTLRHPDIVQRWRRTGFVEQLGEIETMVLARRLGAVIVTDDSNAHLVATAFVGPDRVMSSQQFAKHLEPVTGRTTPGSPDPDPV